jgi:hypothetical protein
LLTGERTITDDSSNFINNKADRNSIVGNHNVTNNYHGLEKEKLFEIIDEKNSYIEKIIKESYDRNKEKDAEITRLTEQNGKLIEIINKLTNK